MHTFKGSKVVKFELPLPLTNNFSIKVLNFRELDVNFDNL